MNRPCELVSARALLRKLSVLLAFTVMMTAACLFAQAPQTTPPPAISPTESKDQAAPTNPGSSPPASSSAQDHPAAPETPATLSDIAWKMLNDGLAEKSPEKRGKAVGSLGLLKGNSQAEKAATEALKDEKYNVRLAAAVALGSMRATHAHEALENALHDEEPVVVLAVANSLMLIKDENPAYDVYYSVLTGTMKTNKGLVKEQMKTLHDPKKVAELGFEEGIGFLPFAGMGYTAVKTVLKSNASALRAAAAKKLAHDPDPKSLRALVRVATEDKNWVVRAAALEALSERGDPSVLPKVREAMQDDREDVRFTAAACAVNLSNLPPPAPHKNAPRKAASPPKSTPKI